MRFKLFAWCPICRDFRRADSGPDPLIDGRVTEILRRHRAKWWHLTACPGSGLDADPV